MVYRFRGNQYHMAWGQGLVTSVRPNSQLSLGQFQANHRSCYNKWRVVDCQQTCKTPGNLSSALLRQVLLPQLSLYSRNRKLVSGKNGGFTIATTSDKTKGRFGPTDPFKAGPGSSFKDTTRKPVKSHLSILNSLKTGLKAEKLQSFNGRLNCKCHVTINWMSEIARSKV